MLLGHELWRDRYGSAPDIVGRTIRANTTQMTVIGVMPPKFGFPIREVLWVPLRVDPLATARGQGPRYPVIGLLKPGVSASEATAQLATIAAQLEHDFRTNAGVSAGAILYLETILGREIYAMLITMLGGNRRPAHRVRQRVEPAGRARRCGAGEVAVRMALGAARGRIIRQHLTEVLVLASAGAAIGILLSTVGMRWFTRRCRSTRRRSGSRSSSITGSCSSSSG